VAKTMLFAAVDDGMNVNSTESKCRRISKIKFS